MKHFKNHCFEHGASVGAKFVSLLAQPKPKITDWLALKGTLTPLEGIRLESFEPVKHLWENSGPFLYQLVGHTRSRIMRCSEASELDFIRDMLTKFPCVVVLPL